ncbi:hypothetical protein CLM86_11510, partial [Pseudomonas aeruginosa]
MGGAERMGVSPDQTDSLSVPVTPLSTCPGKPDLREACGELRYEWDGPQAPPRRARPGRWTAVAGAGRAGGDRLAQG